MSDERAIEGLLVAYASAIDDKRFDRLDDVFVPDAELDFTSAFGRAGRYAEIRPWLERRMSRFVALQHLIGNAVVTVTGDAATCRSYVRAMHVYEEAGVARWFQLGGTYDDALVRTAAGFRIAKRVLRRTFTTGELPTR